VFVFIANEVGFFLVEHIHEDIDENMGGCLPTCKSKDIYYFPKVIVTCSIIEENMCLHLTYLTRYITSKVSSDDTFLKDN
jgi:hypothetical protein